jgi:hypothetical protein
MDNVPVALGLAVLVVLYLLMQCWDDRQQVPARGCDKKPHVIVLREGMTSAEAEADNQRSDSGQGVINRQLQAQENDLANLEEYDDFSAVAKYQALEPEVYESHEQYADQLGISNSGASNMTVRSDPNDVVNWVGLRRPDYHSTYAKSDARQVHSEFADQMFARTYYNGI